MKPQIPAAGTEEPHHLTSEHFQVGDVLAELIQELHRPVPRRAHP